MCRWMAVLALATLIPALLTGDQKERKDPNAGRAHAKAAWQLTDDERLQRRFDSASVRKRAARDAAERRNGSVGALSTSSASAAGEVRNVIHGRHEPELFMPYELYIRLMFASVVEARHETYRGTVEDQVKAITNSDEFWSRLESASAPYTALLQREQVLAAQLGDATPAMRSELLKEIKAVQQPQCAARADALAAAEKSIGREALYRVLYEVVAPTIATNAASDQLDAERIRFVARGCR